jgi:hypothetical protein
MSVGMLIACYFIYRVIHKSLRDSRPLRHSSRDGHDDDDDDDGGGGGHVNRGTDTPSFLVLWGTRSETSVAPSQLTQFLQTARHSTLSYPLSTPCFITTAP